MKGRRNPFVAREGIPFLLAVVIVLGLVWNLAGPGWSLLPFAIFIYLSLIFRDPRRKVPSAPLGVICPVDGYVSRISQTENGAVNAAAHIVTIRVNSLGTYTARCPSEGKIMDFGPIASVQEHHDAANYHAGLWVQTDEGDDVTLQFHGHRFGLAPRAFLRYGERVGQGQRCAYLRLTRFADVQLPINGKVQVSEGQQVSAGTDLLAKLPHH